MSSIHGPSQCDVSLSVTKRSDQGFTQRLQKSIGCKVIGCVRTGRPRLRGYTRRRRDSVLVLEHPGETRV